MITIAIVTIILKSHLLWRANNLLSTEPKRIMTKWLRQNNSPMRRQLPLHIIFINFQVVFFADNFRESATPTLGIHVASNACFKRRATAVPSHREPALFISNENNCTVIHLCPCVVFESFKKELEGSEDGLHFRILSHLPLCSLE